MSTIPSSSSTSISSQFTYSNGSYFPTPFHLQQPQYAAPPQPPAVPVTVPSTQFQQAQQLFQKDAQTITPKALESVKAALATSDIEHKAETKKKAVPRKVAGQTWEDPTLAEWPEKIMSTKEPPPPLPKLMTLNKGLKLAEQWVKNMPGDEEEAGQPEVESRPSRLGLGAKVPRKSHVGPLNDPVERRLYKKLGFGRKKITGEEDSKPTPKSEVNDDDDDDDDENLDSRANAFAKKRAAPVTTTQQAKKKVK